MDQIHLCLGFTVIIALVTACGHSPSGEPARTVRTVEISQQVNPHIMYASPGEEVQWTNARQNPVRVGFFNLRLMEENNCENGIVDMFGRVDDHVTIEPGESISFCPTKIGDLEYNVWFDPSNPRGAISPTLTIKVRGG